eukprot:COSAG02_NODE_133_length_34692_cov_83.845229_4_plen_65_part_00
MLPHLSACLWLDAPLQWQMVFGVWGCDGMGGMGGCMLTVSEHGQVAVLDEPERHLAGECLRDDV